MSACSICCSQFACENAPFMCPHNERVNFSWASAGRLSSQHRKLCAEIQSYCLQLFLYVDTLRFRIIFIRVISWLGAYSYAIHSKRSELLEIIFKSGRFLLIIILLEVFYKAVVCVNYVMGNTIICLYYDMYCTVGQPSPRKRRKKLYTLVVQYTQKEKKICKLGETQRI